MDSEEEDNPAKLRSENRKLEKELRALVVEKNLMEHKLYRAFHKLLQSKKRKIEELERKIKKLKGEEPEGPVVLSDSDTSNNHCKTCRCNGKSPRKKKRLADEEEERVNGRQAEIDDQRDEDSGSDTQDPFAGGYSDDTDLDEEPASKTTSPSKTVVVSCHEPSGVSSIEEVPAATSSKKPPKVTEVITVESTVKEVTPAASKKKNKPEQPEELRDSQKSSSDDLDKLVDEFCA